jgi:hypothetical protein
MAGNDGVQVWNLGSKGVPERLALRILNGPGAHWIIRCIWRGEGKCIQSKPIGGLNRKEWKRRLVRNFEKAWLKLWTLTIQPRVLLGADGSLQVPNWVPLEFETMSEIIPAWFGASLMELWEDTSK